MDMDELLNALRQWADEKNGRNVICIMAEDVDDDYPDELQMTQGTIIAGKLLYLAFAVNGALEQEPRLRKILATAQKLSDIDQIKIEQI